LHAASENLDDATYRNFYLTIKFFPSKAKPSDGSPRNTERYRLMIWKVTFGEIDLHELENMEENVMKNMVEKLGQSVLWGLEQEVTLLHFKIGRASM
jgi:hypothetical protein